MVTAFRERCQTVHVAEIEQYISGHMPWVVQNPLHSMGLRGLCRNPTHVAENPHGHKSNLSNIARRARPVTAHASRPVVKMCSPIGQVFQECTVNAIRIKCMEPHWRQSVVRKAAPLCAAQPGNATWRPIGAPGDA